MYETEMKFSKVSSVEQKPRELSPIERDLAGLRETISDHERVLSALHERLEKIAIPCPPLGDNAVTTREQRSNVGNTMLDQIDRIRMLSGGIHSLLSRLEV